MATCCKLGRFLQTTCLATCQPIEQVANKLPRHVVIDLSGPKKVSNLFATEFATCCQLVANLWPTRVGNRVGNVRNLFAQWFVVLTYQLFSTFAVSVSDATYLKQPAHVPYNGLAARVGLRYHTVYGDVRKTYYAHGNNSTFHAALSFVNELKHCWHNVVATTIIIKQIFD